MSSAADARGEREPARGTRLEESMAEVMRGSGLAEVSCAMADAEAKRTSAVQKAASSESDWGERCIEERFMKALTLGLEAMTRGLT